MKQFNVAVVGATGLVGREFLKVLRQTNFPISSLRAFASQKSAGNHLPFKDGEVVVETLSPHSFEGVDIAFFSAGEEVSSVYAPLAVSSGATVIDNSSRWRMDENCPLVVGGINLDAVRGKRLIANPNCTTIEALLAVYPIIKKAGVTRLNFCTYQAVSGSGAKGISDLKRTLNGHSPQFYPVDISRTCLPIVGSFYGDGYSGEELKMINESKKILSMPSLKVSATCVRVPVESCHGVAISMQTERYVSIKEVKKILSEADGILLTDGSTDSFPTAEAVRGSDVVAVGRVREDLSGENGILLFAYADNLRVGAVTNAVQIAAGLIERGEL